MIETDVELAIVKDQIEYLRGCRDRVFKQTDSNAFMMHLSATGFEKMMCRLLDEVNEYEARVGQKADNEDVHRA